jgi:hypothetical protein
MGLSMLTFDWLQISYLASRKCDFALSSRMLNSSMQLSQRLGGPRPTFSLHSCSFIGSSPQSSTTRMLGTLSKLVVSTLFR